MDFRRILQHKGRYSKCDDRSPQITGRGMSVFSVNASSLLLFLHFWM